MKQLKLLSIILLMGSIALGCGSSGGSSSSGTQVSGSLNSLPNAQLTVSNIGSAASQALKVNQDATNYASQSTSVSSITNSTNGNPNNLPAFGGLSMITQNPSKLVVSPSYLKQTVLDQLKSFKILQYASCNTQPVVTNNSSTSGSTTYVDITSTWSNETCSSGGISFTFNGTISWTGTYDSSAGSANLKLIYTNFNFGETYSGTSMSMTWNGGFTFTGSNMISGASNAQYTEDGKLNLTGIYSSAQGIIGLSGWFSIDDTFTGNTSFFTLVLNEGNEFDVASGSESARIGEYLQTTPSLTISTTSSTTVLNGSGTAGIAYIINGKSFTTGTTSYSGKYSFAFNNLTYDNAICPYCPSSGTLTLTSGTETFVFNYNSTSCNTGQCCADVTGASSPVCW
ncbi:MAG: hypothetical protein M1381_02475 [Deltaproteobacteria bacterium]|nr:hypothetical protein [Deltaproteobacteria bacterium]MCL5791856.1 hypothetical protein [Deltaproteobacteria bacterium]